MSIAFERQFSKGEKDFSNHSFHLYCHQNLPFTISTARKIASSNSISWCWYDKNVFLHYYSDHDTAPTPLSLFDDDKDDDKQDPKNDSATFLTPPKLQTLLSLSNLKNKKITTPSFSSTSSNNNDCFLNPNISSSCCSNNNPHNLFHVNPLSNVFEFDFKISKNNNLLQNKYYYREERHPPSIPLTVTADPGGSEEIRCPRGSTKQRSVKRFDLLGEYKKPRRDVNAAIAEVESSFKHYKEYYGHHHHDWYQIRETTTLRNHNNNNICLSHDHSLRITTTHKGFPLRYYSLITLLQIIEIGLLSINKYSITASCFTTNPETFLYAYINSYYYPSTLFHFLHFPKFKLPPTPTTLTHDDHHHNQHHHHHRIKRIRNNKCNLWHVLVAMLFSFPNGGVATFIEVVGYVAGCTVNNTTTTPGNTPQSNSSDADTPHYNNYFSIKISKIVSRKYKLTNFTTTITPNFTLLGWITPSFPTKWIKQFFFSLQTSNSTNFVDQVQFHHFHLCRFNEEDTTHKNWKFRLKWFKRSIDKLVPYQNQNLRLYYSYINESFLSFHLTAINIIDNLIIINLTCVNNLFRTVYLKLPPFEKQLLLLLLQIPPTTVKDYTNITTAQGIPSILLFMHFELMVPKFRNFFANSNFIFLVFHENRDHHENCTLMDHRFQQSYSVLEKIIRKTLSSSIFNMAHKYLSLFNVVKRVVVTRIPNYYDAKKVQQVHSMFGPIKLHNNIPGRWKKQLEPRFRRNVYGNQIIFTSSSTNNNMSDSDGYPPKDLKKPLTSNKSTVGAVRLNKLNLKDTCIHLASTSKVHERIKLLKQLNLEFCSIHRVWDVLSPHQKQILISFTDGHKVKKIERRLNGANVITFNRTTVMQSRNQTPSTITTKYASKQRSSRKVSSNLMKYSDLLIDIFHTLTHTLESTELEKFDETPEIGMIPLSPIILNELFNANDYNISHNHNDSAQNMSNNKVSGDSKQNASIEFEKCQSILDGILHLDTQVSESLETFHSIINRVDCDIYSIKSNCSYCEEAYTYWICSNLFPIFTADNDLPYLHNHQNVSSFKDNTNNNNNSSSNLTAPQHLKYRKDLETSENLFNKPKSLTPFEEVKANFVLLKQQQKKNYGDKMDDWFLSTSPLVERESAQITLPIPPCPDFCDYVLARCPYLLPQTEYGGEPTFVCDKPYEPRSVYQIYGNKKRKSYQFVDSRTSCYSICDIFERQMTLSNPTYYTGAGSSSTNSSSNSNPFHRNTKKNNTKNSNNYNQKSISPLHEYCHIEKRHLRVNKGKRRLHTEL